jgi:hypothetical protein
LFFAGGLEVSDCCVREVGTKKTKDKKETANALINRFIVYSCV